MKLIVKIIGFIIFIVFFFFALKNTQEVALHFFWDYEIRGPLVLLVLVFFAAGAVAGVLAMTPMLFRYHRDLSRHKKTVQTIQNKNDKQQSARIQPPLPDTLVSK
jgi:putative membrane protein